MRAEPHQLKFTVNPANFSVNQNQVRFHMAITMICPIILEGMITAAGGQWFIIGEGNDHGVQICFNRLPILPF